MDSPTIMAGIAPMHKYTISKHHLYMLNRSTSLRRNLFLGTTLGTTCVSLLMGCSPASETSLLTPYVGTYATTTLIIDEEAVNIEEYGVVGLALEQKGDVLVGSLLVGFPNDAFSFGVLSMTHSDGEIAGEYWLPTLRNAQTEQVPLTVSFDDSTAAIDLQFSMTNAELRFLPEIFSTPDGAGSTVQLVAQKLTDDAAANPEANESDLQSTASQSEAKQVLGAINRAQQAFFLENEAFSGAIADLGLGIAEETDNYSYKAHAADLGAEVHMHAKPKVDGLKSYVSGVFVITSEAEALTTTDTILCESDAVGIPTDKLPYPSLSEGEPTCPEGFTAL